MSDEPWSEQEKCFLLAEILKTSLPSDALMRLVSQHQIRPNWPEVILPKGRNMRSCQEIYHFLSGSPPTFPSVPPQPFSRPPPELHRKRPYHPDSAAAGGRMIAPKPSSFQTDPGSGSPYAIPPIHEPPVKKKRGRPTKAELEARQLSALAAVQGQPPYPPSVPPLQRTSLPSPLTGQPDELISSSSSTGAIPAGMRLTTPVRAGSESAPDTAGSRRKRGRPTKVEVEGGKHESHEDAMQEVVMQESPALASPPMPEPRPPSAPAIPAAPPESRADDIQDRMRVEKFMREHP